MGASSDVEAEPQVLGDELTVEDVRLADRGGDPSLEIIRTTSPPNEPEDNPSARAMHRLTSLRHHRISRPGLILLLVALVVTACPRATGREPLQGRFLIVPSTPHNTFHALLANSRDLGPVSPAQEVSVLALLRDPTSRRRAAELAALYDPRSRSFGHYETPQEWIQRFGASGADVQQVRRLLAQDGLSASWQAGSDWLLVRGMAAAFERIFRVHIHGYVARSGQHFYAAGHDPVVPATLSPFIAGTTHLMSYQDRKAWVVPANGLRPADLRSAYDIDPLLQRHLDGSGETISFVEIDGFRQSDLDAFTTRFGLPAMHPSIAAGGHLTNVEGEAELDLEVAHEIAPGARLVVYNCGGNCSSSDMVNRETQAVRQSAGGVMSISIGGCETVEGSAMASVDHGVFSEADALGESVFVASGDSGAYTCLDQDWGAPPSPGAIAVSAPASDPGVTAVGGTRLSLTTGDTWYREEVWEDAPATSGSGGGTSTYFSRPSWQRGPGVRNGYNTNNRREVPDVAADADPVSGAQVVIKGHVEQVGGTSQAAPIWAGIAALIDEYLRQQGRPAAGFLNPALYTLSAGTRRYPPLHDVTLGSNMVYPATIGYDLATGLGTPDAWNLARDMAASQSTRG